MKLTTYKISANNHNSKLETQVRALLTESAISIESTCKFFGDGPPDLPILKRRFDAGLKEIKRENSTVPESVYESEINNKELVIYHTEITTGKRDRKVATVTIQ